MLIMVPAKYLDSFTGFSLTISQERNNGQVDFSLTIPVQLSDYYNGVNLIDACIHDVVGTVNTLTIDGLDTHMGWIGNPYTEVI